MLASRSWGKGGQTPKPASSLPWPHQGPKNSVSLGHPAELRDGAVTWDSPSTAPQPGPPSPPQGPAGPLCTPPAPGHPRTGRTARAAEGSRRGRSWLDIPLTASERGPALLRAPGAALRPWTVPPYSLDPLRGRGGPQQPAPCPALHVGLNNSKLSHQGQVTDARTMLQPQRRHRQ